MVVLEGARVVESADLLGERLAFLVVIVFFVAVEQVFEVFFPSVQGRYKLGMQIIK